MTVTSRSPGAMLVFSIASDRMAEARSITGGWGPPASAPFSVIDTIRATRKPAAFA